MEGKTYGRHVFSLIHKMLQKKQRKRLTMKSLVIQ
jgi:hypothetical protein